MRIESEQPNLLKIENFDYGQIFRHNNQYYIVTQWACSEHTIMAVNLRNGDCEKFRDDVLVERVACHLTIE